MSGLRSRWNVSQTPTQQGGPVSEQQLSVAHEAGGAVPPGRGRMPGYPRPNLVYFLVFLAFVVFRYVDGGNRMDILATIRFEFLLGGTSVVLSMIKISGRPLEIGQSQRLIMFIGLLFLMMIIQIPFAGDPPEAHRVFNDRVFKFALLTFVIAAMVESPGTLKVFIAAFLFAIFYITLESSQGWATGSLMWQNQGVMRLHGAVPMYGHPNSLGGVAMGTLPFIVFLYGPVKRWFWRMFFLATTVTSMICVIFSGSRTAYMGLLTMVLWWFHQSEKKFRFVMMAVLVGVAAFNYLPREYIDRFESIGGHEAEGHSKETRKVILQDAITILGENPLGIGVASFPAVRTARFGRSQDTHNLYLEVATNLGVQGFVVFMGLVWVMMDSFFKSTRSFKRQRRRLKGLMRREKVPPQHRKALRKHLVDLDFCVGSSQAAAGFILIRLVLGLFGMDLYEIYWWFASGLAIALAGLVVRTSARTRFLEAALTEPSLPGLS